MHKPVVTALTAALAISIGTIAYAAEHKMNTDLVVVGAGSAGLSAAVHASRLMKPLFKNKTIRLIRTKIKIL